MSGFNQLTASGMGFPTLPASSRDAGRELGVRGRFRARRNMRRGLPGWDRTSAIYQVAIARQTERIPMLFGRRGTQIAGVFLVLAFAFGAVSSWEDRGWSVQFAFYVFFGAFFIWAFATFGPTLRNAARAAELNRHLLSDDDIEQIRSAPRPSRRRFSTLITVVFAALIYLVFSKLLDDGDRSWTELAIGAVIWAVLFVALMRWAARRQERRGAASHQPHG